MSTEEEDYSNLSLEERLTHKVWKVRLQAYEELATNIENSRNEMDPIFINFPLDNLKKMLLDSNVVAQETGYNAFNKFLIFGGNAANVSKLKNLGIVGSICEKGLLSSRKNTKEWSIESILLMIEISNDPNSIVEDILPYLTNRLPKLVTGCVNCLASIIENFGCKIISPKPIVPYLSKLFAHADKNVRNETTKLTIELYRWMGDALINALFSDLKPVQQKDLSAAFEKEKGKTPEQKRYTKKQREEIERREQEAAAAAAAAGEDGDIDDVEMSDANGGVSEDNNEYDPLEFVDPVEVLNKFPSDFETRISSSKWKDRKEVLEEIIPILEKSPKLVTTDDYLPVLRIWAKCMNDANIQVVQLAANCIEFVIKGLGDEFSRYQPVVLAPVVERLKEKKPAVAMALDNVLDALFKLSGFGNGILDEAINGMKLKTPQNKIASANFVKRCLSSTKVPPKTSEIDAIMEIGIKLLSESQEPIRQAATEMIGTLMKITGPRELNPFLEKVDENRKNKINDYYENTAQVKTTMTSKSSSVASGSRNVSTAGGASSSTMRPPPSLSSSSKSQDRKVSGASSTIPAKRTASSPAKRDEVKNGRGMTARSLAKPNIPNLRPPTNATQDSSGEVSSLSQQVPPTPTSGASMEEMNLLKQQITKLQEEVQNYKNQQESHLKTIKLLEESNNNYREEIESIKRELSNEKRNATITTNHKDTHINNLKSELEKANYRIKDLEQEREINRLEQSNLAFERSNISSSNNSRNSFYKPSPSKFAPSDISTGVKRLSIGGEENNNLGGGGAANPNFHSNTTTNTPGAPIGATGMNISRPTNSFRSSVNYGSSTSSLTSSSRRESMDIDNGADWKRAAEVTLQLKARIERMKARTRSPLNIE
ncbi:microtubule-associated protein, putative [Candida dubliniensis CD36]|uniref:Microtubule-associated protein, putative n=1 Tax=Candida dubliniensis (strain CD36 / ATCC MYA-646 / CBS 7987 / NCPF 3949 / NRRL Y-17841) TaxID=573826 RepID=B9WMW1_CANDC|nr:microtubule-associated protein, putative [Candida dubliniensis CD36]CAX40427.1 microtubule-associated protein, putative [Candida dubliniensis CD36]